MNCPSRSKAPRDRRRDDPKLFRHLGCLRASADPNAFNNTEPTSSIITLGASDVYNDDKKMIAYVWCDVPGLQKFGSYTSNNNSDGPFIELGFRPAIIWIKVYENL